MKKNWEVKRLGEVCSFENGDRGTNYPSRSVRTNKGIAFINAGHLTGEGLDFDNMNYISRERFDLLGSGKIRRGDILFCLRGSLGKFASVGNLSEGAIASSLVIVRPSPSINPEFLSAYFKSKLCSDMILFYANGAAQPNLSAGSLREFRIPLPPLLEQQRIVAILDEAFAAIAKAKEKTEKNLQNARELFDSYLQGVFASPGEGWEEKKLGEVCILRSGTTLPVAVEKSNGDSPYLKVADMNLEENKKHIITSSRFVNKSDVNANGIIPIGSTIFPKRGGAILTNKKRLTSVAICMDLNLMAVTPHKEILPNFLYYYFLGLDLRKINNGSSIPQINNYSIEPLRFSYPKSVHEQRSIVARLDALSAETKKLEAIYQKKLDSLGELKKSILQKAFNGGL